MLSLSSWPKVYAHASRRFCSSSSLRALAHTREKSLVTHCSGRRASPRAPTG